MKWTQGIGVLLTIIAFIATFGVGIYAVLDAIVAPIPLAKSPGFLEPFLTSRAVVASVRIAIIFAAGFIVISVVALVANRQWLTRVGPVHVSRRVRDLNAESDA